jgi:CheY-like chemotaxis protein
LRKDRTTLSQVVASAVETSGPLIETGRHDLDVSLPAQEVVLEADPTRLAQVFANLLNNAAKYTEPGGVIQLSAAVEGNRVVVKVSDNGVGMNKRAQTDIFDMFVQAHQHRGGGGLGIGLTVAKSLVEMHGGTIAVASAGPGRGSEFVVRLPIESERPGSSTTVESGASRTMRATAQRRILVVDDNIDAAESLAALLGALGHEVSVAHGGQRALEINSSFAPELIFLDLGMPGMDGYEVAKRLRGTMSVERPQIIAMTGWGQDGDRRRTREAGFDFHLVKPVSLESLQSLLSDDGAAARATGSASTGSPPSAS